MSAHKTHAKDYLIEKAENEASSDWLKALIYESIRTNGNIDEIHLDTIYSNLSKGTQIAVNKVLPTTSNSSSRIKFNKLMHNSGINALAQNQTIKFSNDVTILYGLNGSGKSSYFKILHELIGGSIGKELIPNIYNSTPEQVNVNLGYDKNSNSINLVWDGTSRAIDDLSSCKVFDSSYLEGLLEKRNVDETLVQPFGLYLFRYISEKIDELKDKLENEVARINKSKPFVDLSSFTESLESAFQQNSISDRWKNFLENKFVFPTEEQDKLSKINKEIKELSQTNYQDKISLMRSKQTVFAELLKSCTALQNNLTSFRAELNDKLAEYQLNKSKSNQVKQQLEILKQIPATDSDEWRRFIEFGQKYSDKVTDSSTHCIYCKQELKDNSVDIVKAYNTFLSDESQTKLKKTITLINTIKSKVLNTVLSQNDYTRFNDAINNLKDDNLKEQISNLFNGFVNYFNSNKAIIINIIENMQLQEISSEYSGFKELTDLLNRIVQSANVQINMLNEDEKTKADKIKKLNEQQSSLLEHESIFKQKTTIQKWLNLHKEQLRLLQLNASISTQGITILSNKANDELLTENLRRLFKDELDRLGYKKLDVTLEKKQSRKGAASNQLIISQDHPLTSILSEGEQKAVALALFIAETKMQNIANPILLDDPVNSLDHSIAASFANSLLKLDNQVILFNHHRLFLDAFETSKNDHVCKTVDSSCNNNKGKHVLIYQVLSEGKSRKGVLTPYKGESIDNLLTKASELVSNSPFTQENEVAAILRRVIESIIDDKILNRVVPTKYSNKNNRIHWQNLKEINVNPSNIDTLERIHCRLSGGDLHNGTERSENPINKEEFEKIINDLKGIAES